MTPDPRFLYFTEAHREALAALVYGIKERKGFVALTGEAGTGKTTLLYRLVDNLNEKVHTAFIFHTFTTYRELLKNTLSELGLPVTDDDTFLLIDRLKRYLIERASAGEIVALFIDEAQNLSEEALENVCLLSNLETRTTKLLQIVLCGRPELEAKLNATDLKQLRQRIAIMCRIGPLSDAECLDYVEHRLKIVGGNAAGLFTPGAMYSLLTHSGGIPRIINVMCDNALLIGFTASCKKINEAIMLEVIRDMIGVLFHDRPPTPAPSISAPEPAPPAARKRNPLERLLACVSARRRSCRTHASRGTIFFK
ncbi:MAG: AAA family ATPase [Syntrophorhabdales bacterium]|jgi:general secretion pathway protein A